MPDVELRAESWSLKGWGHPDLTQSLDHRTVRTQRELEMAKRVKSVQTIYIHVVPSFIRLDLTKCGRL